MNREHLRAQYANSLEFFFFHLRAHMLKTKTGKMKPTKIDAEFENTSCKDVTDSLIHHRQKYNRTSLMSAWCGN